MNQSRIARLLSLGPNIFASDPSQTAWKTRGAKAAAGVFLASTLLFQASALAAPIDDARTAYDNQDFATALTLHAGLAESGNAEAQFYLGVMYQFGEGVEVNYQVALGYFQQSAENGDDWGAYYLGQFYYHAPGDTVAINYGTAFKWHMKAATQGNAWAALAVGEAYDMGVGVSENDDEAVKWYRMAAEQDIADAQYLMGMVYLRSMGSTEMDLAEAKRWLAKAADQGHERAKARLEGL